MFHEMRRTGQHMTPEEIEAVLTNSTSGVLALSGDDGYPYAVPLSHVYHNGALYFHCATEGHKIDAVKRSEKASFCVVEQDLLVPEEYTTYFRSVIVFGKVSIVQDEPELISAMQALCSKFVPGSEEQANLQRTQSSRRSLCVLKLTPEHKTGKVALALAKQ